MNVSHTLGIDISKDKFDVCLLAVDSPATPQARACFPNSPAGFRRLRRWLSAQRFSRLHACLEATSRYGEGLAQFLFEHQQTMSVVNPRRLRHFADSLLVRTQNDPIDAHIIARFCATQKPALWQPAAAERRALQDFTRLRHFLVGQAQRLKNRLHTENRALGKILRRQIRSLETSIAHLEKQMAAHLQQHPALAQAVALVDSISGLGPVSGATTVAELPPIGQFARAAQLVAYAGLDPRKKDSGSSVRGVAHVSKMGSRPLRAALYMAAVAALTHNPLVRAQAQRLRARGKKGKTLVCAAMRQLVRLIYGVLKHQQAFDPHWRERGRAVPCERAGASGGDEPSSPQLASPPVATA